MAKSETLNLIQQMASDANLTKYTNAVWVEKNFQHAALDVYLTQEGVHSGKAKLLQGLYEWVDAPAPSEVYTGVAPSLRLTHEMAKMLMTHLWNLGVRPEGLNSKGTEVEIEHHLESVRSHLTLESARVDKLIDSFLTLTKDVLGNTK